MLQSELLDQFLSDIHASTDEVAFAGAAGRLAESMGFRWFAYLSFSEFRPTLLSTYPAAWTEHYFANAFDEVDPVVSAARTEVSPFRWGKAGAVRPTDRDGARLFDDAASFGICSGITVPIRRPEGRVAAFTLSTDERSIRLGAHESTLKLAEVCGLQLQSQLCRKIERFRSSDTVAALTTRQKACLTASADGNSAKQTARVIGLTPRTVEHHLEEAKKRLVANSLPHAVAVAFRKRLIT